MNVKSLSLSNPFWLRLARALTLVAILFVLAVFLAGMIAYPSYANRHPEEFRRFSWEVEEMDGMLQRAGLSFPWWLGYNLVTSLITSASFFGIATLLLFRKRPDLFSLFLAFTFTVFGLEISPALQTMIGIAPILTVILTTLSTMVWPLFFTIFFLFPDGRFVPSWTRWAALALILLQVYDALMTGYGAAPHIFQMLATFLLIGTGVGSQIYRYRRYSNPVQRLQTKWVVFAILLFFAILLLTLLPFLAPSALDSDGPLALGILLLTGIAGMSSTVVPISIGIAILRYRLYDIDILIRKTLVYTAVTALLALVYFGGVLLLQSVFARLGDEGSPAVIVLSTLASAALFNPLRKRVQEGVDRRFYRKKYDAEQVLAEFAATARDEVDVERLRAALAAAVEETVQPESVSVWLRPVANGRTKLTFDRPPSEWVER